VPFGQIALPSGGQVLHTAKMLVGRRYVDFEVVGIEPI